MKPHWTFTFFVAGIPAPGGSKNAFVPKRKDGSFVYRRKKDGSQGGLMVNVVDDGGKRTKEWRKVVAWSAKQQWNVAPVSGPCGVEYLFLLPRPKCHYGTGRNAAQLRDDAPRFHITTPDALKLARSTEDSLTGIVYTDDKLTVKMTAEKRWAELGQTPGCLITVRAL